MDSRVGFKDDSLLPQIKHVVLGETIGQGAFACVKNAHLEADPNVIIAVKFIHMPTCKKYGLNDKDVAGEVILHSRCSKHPNVLRVIDCNISQDYFWIAMEMADGGDLFDKIEPDVGVDADVAQFYFQQLVNAVTYLHEQCDVAHRDIKPENILLDKNGNLKLADFGLASRFRRKDGSLKISSDQRGSPPYMAPEILHSGEYYADMTDIWSIGVLIFVILTGETPWEFPSFEDENFELFISNKGNLNLGTWSKLDFTHLNLLRKILQPDPAYRISLAELRQHPWFTARARLSNSNGLCKDASLLAEKLLSNLRISLSDDEYNSYTQDPSVSYRNKKVSSTQPVETDLAGLEHDAGVGNAFTQYDSLRSKLGPSATQDTRWMQYMSKDVAALQFLRADDRELSSYLQFNPNRLTRFYSDQSIDAILPIFEKGLQFTGIKVRRDMYQHFVKLTQKLGESGVYPLSINIKTIDRKGASLCGTALIQVVEDDLKSITFARKSGDPLEWRRLFKKIALLCRDIILVPN
ncbi:hypothetical protein HG535_0C04790 [Zygotorulaspora mrakii]|uniref:non-specific serine/threonine protein kinase n=1 Tax=Zygotorulaspora mrakii TaxID=42260 RepID=A0A7H9B0B0_ZYGMR|nr:uncharacterized protein HG535_0C04790 [Zygotorulaspora mrakii]QLG72125.1 hypothetical protein HG535_0C04790 [Zygotorulaspora mrakii]